MREGHPLPACLGPGAGACSRAQDITHVHMQVRAVGLAPHAHPGLRALLSIMLGDERSLRSACTNWAELLAALLLWRFPDASPQLHLGQLLASAADQMGSCGEAANEAFLEVLREVSHGHKRGPRSRGASSPRLAVRAVPCSSPQCSCPTAAVG